KHRRSDDQPAVAVEDDTGEVARLADDGGIARTVEMIVHLLDQAGDLVAQDLDQHGVHGHARSRIRLCNPSTRAVQPGGMTLAASNCPTMAGPAITAPIASRSRS